MPDADNADETSFAEIIEANIRPWNSYWFWRDKPIGERGAAHDILSAACCAFEELVSREPGQDPPDCEALIDGHRVGIEVTELVHQKALERSLKAQKARADGRNPSASEVYFVWDRSEFLRAIQGRISAKDRGTLKGGPYSRYILVIYTDEMFLEAKQMEEWLMGATFLTNQISDVLLGLSYDPHQKCCSVFKLRVCSSAQTD